MFKDGMPTWLSQLLTPLIFRGIPHPNAAKLTSLLPLHATWHPPFLPTGTPPQGTALVNSQRWLPEYELFPIMRTSASSPLGFSTWESSRLPSLPTQRDNIWRDAGAFDIPQSPSPSFFLVLLLNFFLVTGWSPIRFIFSSFREFFRVFSPLAVQAPATSPPGLFQPIRLQKRCLPTQWMLGIQTT